LAAIAESATLAVDAKAKALQAKTEELGLDAAKMKSKDFAKMISEESAATLRDKVLAALRAGIHTVVIPAGNEGQLVEVPDEAREQVTVVLAADLGDVIPAAIPG